VTGVAPARLVGELADTSAAIGHLLAQIDQPTKFGHKLLLAEGQGGFVADTSLRRQREPA
jgi:hypothetical protein